MQTFRFAVYSFGGFIKWIDVNYLDPIFQSLLNCQMFQLYHFKTELVLRSFRVGETEAYFPIQKLSFKQDAGFADFEV